MGLCKRQGFGDETGYQFNIFCRPVTASTIRQLTNIMKWAYQILFLVGIFISSCSTQHVSPAADAQLYRLALSPSLGGSPQKPLFYRGSSLLVIYRNNLSRGVATEPFVFVQTSKGWHCLYHHTSLPFEMYATIKRDRLVLWKVEWVAGERQLSKYWNYDLRHLDAY